MKCEACGGDGQIEYGAYRGDEAGPTRECRLCGGRSSDDTVGEILDQFAFAATQAGIPLSRFSVVPHVHLWERAGNMNGRVRFVCTGCRNWLLFTVHGSLSESSIPPPPSDVLRDLARQVRSSNM